MLLLLGQACRGEQRQGEPSQYPDGYFPFEESPTRTPPKVRRPPYAQADVDCPGNYFFIVASSFFNRRIYNSLTIHFIIMS